MKISNRRIHHNSEDIKRTKNTVQIQSPSREKVIACFEISRILQKPFTPKFLFGQKDIAVISLIKIFLHFEGKLFLSLSNSNVVLI